VQPSPDGLAQAYLAGEGFPRRGAVGDGAGRQHLLRPRPAEILCGGGSKSDAAGTVFGYRVADPERYGVVDFGPGGEARAIIEKPKVPPSQLCGHRALFPRRHRAGARRRRSSPRHAASSRSRRFWKATCARGARRQKMGRGFAWLDTGTHASLLDAANFVRTLTERQGMQSGSPEEIAYAQGWITADQLHERISLFTKNAYGDYLKSLL
jgi:glucose-1-phosphate thymidylyltransferase